LGFQLILGSGSGHFYVGQNFTDVLGSIVSHSRSEFFRTIARLTHQSISRAARSVLKLFSVRECVGALARCVVEPELYFIFQCRGPSDSVGLDSFCFGKSTICLLQSAVGLCADPDAVVLGCGDRFVLGLILAAWARASRLRDLTRSSLPNSRIPRASRHEASTDALSVGNELKPDMDDDLRDRFAIGCVTLTVRVRYERDSYPFHNESEESIVVLADGREVLWSGFATS